MSYKTFSKAQFESELKYIVAKNRLGVWNFAEITAEVAEHAARANQRPIPIYEYIYKVPTKSPVVDLLVYSSVDRNTGKTRDYGSDAVRVVMRWTFAKKHPDGSVIVHRLYRKIHKHLRIDTLFANLEATIMNNQQTTSGLIYSNFVPEKDYFSAP